MKVYVDRLCGDKSAGVIKLLEYAVKTEYGMKMPEILRDEYGKPFFSPEVGVYFSLSHSGEWGICAVSRHPVGADIQEIRDVLPRTLQRICTERELSNLDFISLWSLKESFIKLNGRLDRAYREIEFLPAGALFSGPDGCFGKLFLSVSGYKIAVCGFDSRETDGCDVCNLL